MTSEYVDMGCDLGCTVRRRLEGKRRKGRPTRRWTEDIKKWLPMSPTEAGREAQKRDVFRRMVRETTSTQTCQDEEEEEYVEKRKSMYPEQRRGRCGIPL